MSSSLLRTLICYGSASYSEIFNALGTDIVTANFSHVKGSFNELRSNLVLGFQGSAFLGKTTLQHAQRGVIILPAGFVSRVNQRDRQKNEHKTGML